MVNLCPSFLLIISVIGKDNGKVAMVNITKTTNPTQRINTSTNYIAMIELERKTPSIPMLERIAEALRIDPTEPFSQKKALSVSLRKLHKTVLKEIEKAVNNVISERLNEVENDEDYQNEAIKT